MPIYPYSFTMPPVNKQDIPSDGVVGEFLGISAGGVLDWLPVSASGSGDMLAANNLSELTNDATARTNIGLGTTDSPEFANLTLTSPSLSSSAPVTISQTWNDLPTAFTALKVNATSTNSAASSKLLDLQLGGVSQFNVDKGGTVTSVSSGNYPSYAVRFSSLLSGIGAGSSSGTLLFWSGNAAPGFGNANLCLKGDTVHLRHAGRIVFGQADFGWGAEDTILLRDGAANTLALRNGGNAQTFNVYGTSSASNANYARLALTCGLDGNATISTQALGTGTAGTVSINGVPVGLGKGNVAGNVAVGDGALNANTTSDLNTTVGKNAARLITGSNSGANAIFGSQALFSATVNTNGLSVLGINAFYNLTGGVYSVAIGQFAGGVTSTGANTTYSDGSIFIGSRTKSFGASSTNEIVIGESAIGIGSNSVVLGNDSITKTALKGNVGIGTTAPGAKLQVSYANQVLTGNVTDTDMALKHHIAAYTSDAAGINVGASLGLGGYYLSSSNYTTFGAIAGRKELATNNNAQGYLSFLTASNGSGLIERMRIDSVGNVGIGTTSPTSKLHVAETWNAAGTTFAAAKIVVTDTASAAASNLLELWSGSTPALKSYVTKSGSFVGGVVGANQPSALSFPNSGSYSVGIYNPASYKIQFSMSSADPGGVVAGAYTGLQYEMTAGVLSWGTTAQDIVLLRDGEQDHLAMRRGALGQKFSVYGTYPGAAWERFTITAPTSGNVLLGTYKGTGGIARGLSIQTDGATAIDIGATGNIGIGTPAGASKLNVTGSVDVTLLRSGFYVQSNTQFMFGIGGVGDTALQRNAAGVVEINSTTAGTYRDLRVRSVIQQPPATITPDTNGDLVVEATNNTTLTFRLKGSDGTVRSGTITLSV